MTVVSRQREWSRSQVAKGNCSKCGKPREMYAMLCNTCQIKKRLAERHRLHRQRHVVGGPGRPPYVSDEGQSV